MDFLARIVGVHTRTIADRIARIRSWTTDNGNPVACYVTSATAMSIARANNAEVFGWLLAALDSYEFVHGATDRALGVRDPSHSSCLPR